MAKSKKKPSAAKSKAQSTAQAPPPPPPLIDTAKAAQTAAAMIASGKSSMATAGTASTPDGSKAESSAFRQLKESMNKPHSAALGSVLDKTAMSGQKKSAAPFPGGKQVGHNQTFGADVSRRSVPRRTGG